MYLPELTDQKPEFVQICWVKKGAAKPTDKKKPGQNLDDLMRVEFLEGQEIYEKQFMGAYGTLTPDKINIWFPFPTIEQVWSASYRAFQANERMVAEGGALVNEKGAPLYYKSLWDVNEKRNVIFNWKDLETGELVPFDPTVPYEYVPDGKKKKVSLEFKAYGYLKFLIRELDVIGFAVLRTTAIGDIRNISKELAGFEEMTRRDPDGLRNTPFILYRMPGKQNIPGKEMRKNEWYVHLATDPGWVSKKRAQALEGAPSLQIEAPEEIIDAEIVEIANDILETAEMVAEPPKVDPEDPIVRFATAHLAAVVSAGHAADVEHALEVLKRSELDKDVTTELAVRWAKYYRGLRDEGKTAAQAAGGANAGLAKMENGSK